jgi:hypothetical protein
MTAPVASSRRNHGRCSKMTGHFECERPPAVVGCSGRQPRPGRPASLQRIKMTGHFECGAAVVGCNRRQPRPARPASLQRIKMTGHFECGGTPAVVGCNRRQPRPARPASLRRIEMTGHIVSARYDRRVTGPVSARSRAGQRPHRRGASGRNRVLPLNNFHRRTRR